MTPRDPQAAPWLRTIHEDKSVDDRRWPARRSHLLLASLALLAPGCSGTHHREVAPVGETVNAAPPPGSITSTQSGDTPLPSQEPPHPQATPASLVAAVTLASVVGERLHLHDTWAAAASDAVLSRKGARPDPGVKGWVVEERGSGAVVHFVRGAATSAMRVTFPGKSDSGAAVEATEAPLSPELQRAFRARLSASSSEFPKLSRSYNPVVLPASLRGEQGFLVYLLAATSSPNEMILGGHSCVHVTEDGNTVTAIEPLSKTLVRVAKQAPGKGSSVAAFVTHLLTETPNETHVAASLEHRLPIMVGTSAGLWRVEGTTITFFGKPPRGGGP